MGSKNGKKSHLGAASTAAPRWPTWLVLGVALAAAPARADGAPVTATGEATVTSGDAAAARERAVALALRHCVEQAVGVTLESAFVAEASESGGHFAQEVRDQLAQRSTGFVEHYEVLQEQRQGDTLQVTVRATVFASKLAAEAHRLHDLLAAAGRPKIMVVLQELTFDPNGVQQVSRTSLLASFIEQELLARGFELRGGPAGQAAAQRMPAAFDAFLADPQGAARLARQAGADVMVVGRMEVVVQGPQREPEAFAALQGQTRIVLTTVVHGINAATGETLSAKPVQMKSFGLSVERAVHRALRGSGDNVVGQVMGGLVEDLCASFRAAAEGGQSYQISLANVRSYRHEGQAFLAALQAVGGVSQVTQTAFDSGLLAATVQCRCSTAELQQRIFAAAHDAALATLDVAEATGKRLSFRLGP